MSWAFAPYETTSLGNAPELTADAALGTGFGPAVGSDTTALVAVGDGGGLAQA